MTYRYMVQITTINDDAIDLLALREGLIAALSTIDPIPGVVADMELRRIIPGTSVHYGQQLASWQIVGEASVIEEKQ